jgi:hypothetical protein
MVPIVDGKYEQKLSTVYSTPDEALEEVKRKMKRARKIRISNIPTTLLLDLAPLLQDKDLKIILPEGEQPPQDVGIQAEFASAKAKIYIDYKGREAAAGNIDFPDVMFNITWFKESGEIVAVEAMEYSKCVKCMTNETFDSAWRYAQKWI